MNSCRGQLLQRGVGTVALTIFLACARARSQPRGEGSDGCPAYLGSGENGLARCDMNQQDYMEGYWHRIPAKCQPRSLEELGNYAYPYVSDCNTNIHSCTPENDVCAKKVVHMSKYAWFPAKCSLETWNATKFSEKLGRKKLLLVGDSIQVQQFHSLAQLMLPVTDPGAFDDSGGMQFHTIHGGAVYMTGSQFLVGETMNGVENQPLTVDPNALWLGMAKQVDLIVMNTGHHWHRRDETFENYRTMASNVLQALKDEFRGSHVIFRTSNWGHSECQNIKRPLADVSSALQDDPYQWLQPIRSEKVWKEVADEKGVRFQFNNASIALLRGDAHVDTQHSLKGEPFIDCLHNCMPGVPDFWNWLLYNSLMQMEFPSAATVRH